MTPSRLLLAIVLIAAMAFLFVTRVRHGRAAAESLHAIQLPATATRIQTRRRLVLDQSIVTVLEMKRAEFRNFAAGLIPVTVFKREQFEGFPFPLPEEEGFAPPSGELGGRYAMINFASPRGLALRCYAWELGEEDLCVRLISVDY